MAQSNLSKQNREKGRERPYDVDKERPQNIQLVFFDVENQGRNSLN